MVSKPGEFYKKINLLLITAAENSFIINTFPTEWVLKVLGMLYENHDYYLTVKD
jgi:hypothetical protein